MIRAGTFPGCDRAWPDLKESTFWHRWRRAKEAIGRSAPCPTCRRRSDERASTVQPVKQSSGVLERIAAELEAEQREEEQAAVA